MLITDFRPVAEHSYVREVGNTTEIVWTQKERDTIVFRAMIDLPKSVFIDDIHCEVNGWSKLMPEWVSTWLDRTITCRAIFSKAD